MHHAVVPAGQGHLNATLSLIRYIVLETVLGQLLRFATPRLGRFDPTEAPAVAYETGSRAR